MALFVFAIIMIWAAFSANNRKRRARKEQPDKIHELLEEVRKLRKQS